MTDAIPLLGTDLAFINPGSLVYQRLPKVGAHQDVYEMDPFGNEIVLFNLTGHEMRNLFQCIPTDDHLPIYPSGMTMRYMLNPMGSLKMWNFNNRRKPSLIWTKRIRSHERLYGFGL